MVTCASSEPSAEGPLPLPPPVPLRWAVSSKEIHGSSSPVSPAPSGANSCGALLGDYRGQDAQLRQEEREREAELRSLEQARWTRTVRTLEEEVTSRRIALSNAQELARERRRLAEEEEQHNEARAQAGNEDAEFQGTRDEAVRWRTAGVRASEAVERLEMMSGQELIRAERLRGCALVQQARCLDLERLTEARSAQVQKLTTQVNGLQQRNNWCHQEAEQERNLWILRRRELERALEDVQRASADVRTGFEHQRQEHATKRERVFKNMRAQLERQEVAIMASGTSEAAVSSTDTVAPAQGCSQISGRRRPSSGPPGSPGSPSRRRIASPGASGGSRVASLRSALHRQEESSKKELQVLRSKVFTEQQQARSFSSLTSRLSKARSDLASVEDTLAQCRARHKEHECRLQLAQAQLENRPSELHRKITAIQRAAGLADLSKLGSGLFAEAETEAQAAKALVALSKQNEQEFRLTEASHHAAVAGLRSELEERRSAAVSSSVQALASARARPPVDVERRIQAIWQTHHADQAARNAACDEQLWQLDNEASQAEAAYLRLRHALVSECEEAERLHDDLIEEQVEQRRKLVEQLAESGAGTVNDADFGGLLDVVEAAAGSGDMAASHACALAEDTRSVSPPSPSSGRSPPRYPMRTQTTTRGRSPRPVVAEGGHARVSRAGVSPRAARAAARTPAAPRVGSPPHASAARVPLKAHHSAMR